VEDVRFAVTRTSVYDDEKAPCREAVKGTLAYWDNRTCKSFEEFERSQGHSFLDRGTEHQIVYGPRGGAVGIQRRTHDRTAWFIEFDSLDALMAFREKYGDLILTSAFGNEDQPSIEIYDGWRE
jgi:hypothetical protein